MKKQADVRQPTCSIIRTYALVRRNQMFGIVTLSEAAARLSYDQTFHPLPEEVQ
ncbi:hypothetical protein NIES3974_16730 [Calothrix sp. NIES-3974]|nr:hypothetical protein NIES3974_16730 [Calothrix sp. NIES-3974]